MTPRLRQPVMNSTSTRLSTERRDKEFGDLVDWVMLRLDTMDTDFTSAMNLVLRELRNLVNDTPLESAMDSSSNYLAIEDSLRRRHEIQSSIVKVSTITIDTASAITLDSLPGEIYLHILDNLREERDWRTIFNLRAVNRKWSLMTAPYIAVPIGLNDWEVYATETYSDEDAANEVRIINEVSPIGRLCYKLVQPNSRPDWIKVLLPVRICTLRRSVLENTTENRARLEQVLAPVEHILSWDLREDIILTVLARSDGGFSLSQDAEFAMVLATCAGLEHIHTFHESSGVLSKKVIQCAGRQAQESAAKGQVHMLGQLKRLDFEAVTHQIEVGDVIDILHLPKIQDIRLHDLVDGSRGPLSPSTNNPIQRPIDLTLCYCNSLTDGGLACILACCPKIRTLYLESWMPPVFQASWSEPSCYTSALDTYGQSLEFLWLNTKFHTHDLVQPSGLAQVPGEAQRLLRAIKKMRNLRTLVLWREDFDDSESLESMLPSSLRELMIIDHRDKEDDGGKVTRLGFDRESLLSLVHHPNLPNLEIVLVVSPEAYGIRTWTKFVDYCKDFRQLPPSLELNDNARPMRKLYD
ncbi:hypothetical protein Hte_004900 [Hypoxylon texense]